MLLATVHIFPLDVTFVLQNQVANTKLSGFLFVLLSAYSHVKQHPTA